MLFRRLLRHVHAQPSETTGPEGRSEHGVWGGFWDFREGRLTQISILSPLLWVSSLWLYWLFLQSGSCVFLSVTTTKKVWHCTICTVGQLLQFLQVNRNKPTAVQYDPRHLLKQLSLFLPTDLFHSFLSVGFFPVFSVFPLFHFLHFFLHFLSILSPVFWLQPPLGATAHYCEAY